MIAIDRSSWGRLRVTGGDRARFLQGLTTVNVEALAEGGHGWGAILNPKGRVLSVIDIARAPGDGGYVIACEPQLAEPTRARRAWGKPRSPRARRTARGPTTTPRSSGCGSAAASCATGSTSTTTTFRS